MRSRAKAGIITGMACGLPTLGLPLLGIDNKSPDTQLARDPDEGGGSWVRDAVNVHLTARGTFAGRSGYTKALDILRARSMWPVYLGGEYMALCAAGEALVVLREQGGVVVPTVLRLDICGDRDISVAVVDGWGMVTNGRS